MPKAYLTSYKTRTKPEEGITDYVFDSHPENGLSWGSEEQADIHCAYMNTPAKVSLPSPVDGKPHLCSGFKSEQTTSGEFVIFCEVPFGPKNQIPKNQ